LLALAPRRAQLLVIDDVRVMTMINLWRSFPLAKIDIGSFGHWSGTGLAIRREPLDWTPPAPEMAAIFKRSQRRPASPRTHQPNTKAPATAT
jgi:hypothetical protein